MNQFIQNYLKFCKDDIKCSKILKNIKKCSKLNLENVEINFIWSHSTWK
jgi:hypothetical protein